jgi:SAM-dependent methyltransferase
MNLERRPSDSQPSGSTRQHWASRLGHLLRQAVLLTTFRNSTSYWENRYRIGGTSGKGSYQAAAEFKAEVLNDFVSENEVRSVIEFGCGDGNQLALAEYPLYLGLDVSRSAVERCRGRFGDDPTKSFLQIDPDSSANLTEFLSADLTLSLDVVYHLVEDQIYDHHLSSIFLSAGKFVIVYSSNTNQITRSPHVRHRCFTDDVAHRFHQFRLIRRMPNRHPEFSHAEFFFYERIPSVNI